MPPGKNASKNPKRNHTGFMPKKAPSPPQTPANTRSVRDLRKGGRELSMILSPFAFHISYTLANRKGCMAYLFLET
jgi:hypothetical protein